MCVGIFFKAVLMMLLIPEDFLIFTIMYSFEKKIDRHLVYKDSLIPCITVVCIL